MAESILKLSVDSSEYNQKIKRAAEYIQQYAQKCREAGGTLEHLDEGVLEFVQALGKMDTVATGTKQQLREMSNALTTLTTTYRGLTDAEKSSGFGQELAKQIQILTERAGEAKDAMGDVEQSIKNAASDTRTFDQLAGGMTVMTSTFQTATGAAKLFGIQLGDDVKVIADLQAAMAVTSGLQQLQNLLQKQSALMQGVNALQKEFNILAKANPYVLLATAVAAVAGAYLAWTSNAREAEKAQKALNAEIENTKTQIAQIDKDTDFSVGIAQAAGKSWKAIHELRLEAARTKLQLADMNFDKLLDSGASAEQLKQAQEMQQKAWDDVMKVLNEGTIHDVQMRSGKGGKGGKGGNKTDKPTYAADSISAQEALVSDLQKKWKDAGAGVRDQYLTQLIAAEKQLEKMKNDQTILREQMEGRLTLTGKDIDLSAKGVKAGGLFGKETERALAKPAQLSDKALTELNKNMEAQMKQSIKMAKQSMKEEKTITKVISKSKQFTGGLSEVSDGLKGLGIELPEGFDKLIGIINSVISVIEGVNAVIGVFQVGSTNANTAALIANTTAMYATGFLPFKNGGVVPHAATGMMVPGTDFSDHTPVMVSSGELILNKAQQGNLASILQGSGMQNTRLEAVVRGEQLFLAENNRGRRTGHGEIVQSRRTNR